MSGTNMASQMQPIIIFIDMDKKTKNECRVEIVVRKRPKKHPYMKEYKDGSKAFIVELTQDEMDVVLNNYLNH